MKKSRLGACVLASCLALSVQGAWADLSSPTYRAAKAAYAGGDFQSAFALLQQYVSEDGAFVQSHQGVSQAIAQAMAYCQERTSRMLFAAGAVAVNVEPPPSPPLP